VRKKEEGIKDRAPQDMQQNPESQYFSGRLSRFAHLEVIQKEREKEFIFLVLSQLSFGTG
jgi:hypothetical protein